MRDIDMEIIELFTRLTKEEKQEVIAFLTAKDSGDQPEPNARGKLCKMKG